MPRFLVYAPSRDFADEPAFRIRMLNLVDALARQGFDLDIQPRPKSPWGRLVFARAACRYDGVILHRKMLDPYEARALRIHLPRGARIFLDIDDATMLHETSLGGVARRRLERRFKATLPILDVVCAGNGYLARMFQSRGIPTTVIPSALDPGAYTIKQTATAPASMTLVWIGSTSTLKYLEASFPALQLAAQRVRNLRLTVICDREPVACPLPLEFIPWTLAGEAAALLRGDIGIAPTPENAWTQGKCGFKIVQYMAAGLPVIASPVGLNAELVQPADPGVPCGMLPAAWRDWPAAIEQLAGDPALRSRLGTVGRRRVEDELSVAKVAEQWGEVLRS